MPRFALVVDDDPAARQYIILALAEAGFETRRATSGESAMRLLPTVPPGAVVILDMLLGDSTGEELAGHIRHARPDLAILRVTGTAAGEILAPGEVLLTKPLDAKALQRAAIAALERA